MHGARRSSVTLFGNVSHQLAERQKSEAPSESVTREFTLRSVFFVLILSCIMAASNTYLCLSVGLTVSVSIPASIVATALLRPFGTTPQEINIIQSGTSAGSLVAIGLNFTLPALILIGYWGDIQWFQATVIALVGGALGCIMGIPLRRAFILCEEPLTYPEGMASADIINTLLPPEHVYGSSEYVHSRHRNRKSLILVALGFLLGGGMKLASSSLFLWDATPGWGFWVAQRFVLYFGMSLSPGLASIGYILGFLGSHTWLVGGVLCWWVFTPLVMIWNQSSYPADLDPVDAVFDTWASQSRFIGIGALLLASLAVILTLLRPMFSSLSGRVSTYADYWNWGMMRLPLEERDLPPALTLSILFGLVGPYVGLVYYFCQDWTVTAIAILITVLCGFLFASIAAWQAGGGSAMTPVLGATLSTVILASLAFLAVVGFETNIGPATAILVGAFVCCMISVSSEGMQDHKAGNILGSTPYKQQFMQAVGLVGPALVIPLVMSLIISAYGIGEPTDEYPDTLLVPQAQLIADVSYAFFFGSSRPIMMGIGAAMAVLIIILDVYLKYSQAPFRMRVLGVALGMYLSFESVITFVLGAVFAWVGWVFLNRVYPDNPEYVKKNMRFGLMFAEGLVTGESLVGILFAIPVVVTGDRYVFSVTGGSAVVSWPGILLLTVSMVGNMLAVIYPALLRRYINDDDERAEELALLSS